MRDLAQMISILAPVLKTVSIRSASQTSLEDAFEKAKTNAESRFPNLLSFEMTDAHDLEDEFHQKTYFIYACVTFRANLG